mmetsp:Transcript_24168/g.57814  ORF Transcript_24168/g.57814 Transcript_24168/m.57814 type:complete len:213 (+) Transcript_24168:133-771(+)
MLLLAFGGGDAAELGIEDGLRGVGRRGVGLGGGLCHLLLVRLDHRVEVTAADGDGRADGAGGTHRRVEDGDAYEHDHDAPHSVADGVGHRVHVLERLHRDLRVAVEVEAREHDLAREPPARRRRRRRGAPRRERELPLGGGGERHAEERGEARREREGVGGAEVAALPLLHGHLAVDVPQRQRHVRDDCAEERCPGQSELARGGERDAAQYG